MLLGADGQTVLAWTSLFRTIDAKTRRRRRQKMLLKIDAYQQNGFKKF